ncbi:hypothetical protein BKA62DRAFT_775483 [Auriculariales sp. MPI-PUGE-AT-0066]|nr:hypothetical protein BKA62DRAFT_775483 [Auriculariales sp. MPI-PUGE-AT-0066]
MAGLTFHAAGSLRSIGSFKLRSLLRIQGLPTPAFPLILAHDDLGPDLATIWSNAETSPLSPVNEECIDIATSNGQGRVFTVRAAVLRASCDYFNTILQFPEPDSTRVCVEEDAETWESLIAVLEVMDDTTFNFGQSLISSLAAAAMKYEMESTFLCLRRETELQLSNPLWQYALATRFGWETLALAAGTASLDYPIELTPEIVTHLGISHLAQLMNHRQRRIDAFLHEINDGGRFKQENEARCPQKHNYNRTKQRTHDTAWPLLKRSMTVSIMQKPSGTEVLRDMQAVNAVKNARCPHGELLYRWESIERRIFNVVSALPPFDI